MHGVYFYSKLRYIACTSPLSYISYDEIHNFLQGIHPIPQEDSERVCRQTRDAEERRRLSKLLPDSLYCIFVDVAVADICFCL
jgi:hypothetical protein